MITRETMIEPVLRASPRFEPVWSEILAEWEEEAKSGELPVYLVLGELARYIARLLQEGEPAEVKQVFDVVEQWHLDGDAYVREAATIGLLENLQNTNVVGEGMPVKLAEFLGPESKRWWGKVERFWSKGELIQDD